MLSRPLRLIDLVASGGLARIGADARLFAGEHSISQRWSKALWTHRAKPDGILYPTRHDPARVAACVLYDHCETLVTAPPLGGLADPMHSALLGNILDTYGFDLIDGVGTFRRSGSPQLHFQPFMLSAEVPAYRSRSSRSLG